MSTADPGGPSSSQLPDRPPLPHSSSTDPQTPTFTPAFSSPDTPSATLQTPAQSQSSKHEVGGVVMDLDPPPAEDTEEGYGLGYGDLGQSPSGASGKGKEKVLGREQPISGDQGVGPSNSAGVSPRNMSTGRLLGDEVEDEDASSGFPDVVELQAMRKRLDELRDRTSGEGSSPDGAELSAMVSKLLKPVLEELPFLRSQIDAQRQTIVTLQQQAKVSEQLMNVERDRHAAEREGWRKQSAAMMKVRDEEIAAGTRPNKLLDLDVGYHQELEAANKRLEMDNRLMAPRLADTQRQIDKLVNELRHLRAHVVMSASPLDDPENPLNPPQSRGLDFAGRPKSTSPSKARLGQTTMGDARTEHLLLAARKVRTMRQRDDRLGHLTLEELKRNGVVGPDGGVGYVEGYGGLMLEQEDAEDEMITSSEDEEKPSSKSTPLLPRAKRSGKRSMPAPQTPRSKTKQAPMTTPGGSNFNDLLRAAEMADRQGSPTPGGGAGTSGSIQVPLSTTSATRSTHRARANSTSDRGSPVKRPRRDPPATDWIPRRRNDAASDSRPGTAQPRKDDYKGILEEAGLDLLAQASQLDVAQNTAQSSTAPLPSSSRLSGVTHPVKGGGDKGLQPAIDLRAGEPSTSTQFTEDVNIDPSLRDYQHVETPHSQSQQSQRRSSNAAEVHTPARRVGAYPESGSDGEGDAEQDDDERTRQGLQASVLEPSPGAFASPTGATVPGLGKYVHLTSTIPARRMRSPYLKWTVEEDELLARAVAMHGEKWDLVSKGVPTRSYHQVRQRWLRKTGAFDKKPGHEGRMTTGEDDANGSPTPTPGKGAKKRKASISISGTRG